MESTGHNKPRGFIKSKLARTFRRMTKRSWPVQLVSNYKVTPAPTPSASNGSVSFNLSRHQDLPDVLSPMRGVTTTGNSYNKPMNNHHRDSNGSADYGGGDENVDMKAAKYILYVRERFKQERVDANAF